MHSLQTSYLLSAAERHLVLEIFTAIQGIREALKLPKAIERKLEKEASKKGLKGARKRAYVYGTLRHKFGWKPKREQ